MGRVKKRKWLTRTHQVSQAPKAPLLIESLKDALDVHAEWMTTVNYAAATIQARRRNLSLFIEWCEDRGVAQLKQVTVALVERYPKHLYQSKDTRTGTRRSAGAQAQHLMAIREFFRWCYRKKYLGFNPASEIDLPLQERRIPRGVLSPEQVEKVMAQVDTTRLAGIRDRAILETFYSTGIRRQELANLAISDVQANPGSLLVRLGKGKKDRFIPIGERALTWIAKYADEVRPTLATEDDPGNLFLDDDGSPMPVGKFTEMVHGYITGAKVAKKGACHMLRHAMATAMMDRGADIRFIQKMLGHADIQATQIYTHVSLQKLREVYEATHPGAKLHPDKAKGKAVRKPEKP